MDKSTTKPEFTKQRIQDFVKTAEHTTQYSRMPTLEIALQIIKQLQGKLEISQKLLSDLGFRKDYESENDKLRKLLADLYDAEGLLYQDYCCSGCDVEQRDIVKNTRERVREFFKSSKRTRIDPNGG